MSNRQKLRPKRGPIKKKARAHVPATPNYVPDNPLCAAGNHQWWGTSWVMEGYDEIVTLVCGRCGKHATTVNPPPPIQRG